MSETKDKVRVYLSPKHWQDVNGMREPGESFDDVVGRMVDDLKLKKILSEMDDMIEHGEFVDLKDVPEYQKAIQG
jgi:hypothetical protein